MKLLASWPPIWSRDDGGFEMLKQIDLPTSSAELQYIVRWKAVPWCFVRKMESTCLDRIDPEEKGAKRATSSCWETQLRS